MARVLGGSSRHAPGRRGIVARLALWADAGFLKITRLIASRTLMAHESPGHLVKNAGSDSVGLRRNLKFCVSNKFLGDAGRVSFPQ